MSFIAMGHRIIGEVEIVRALKPDIKSFIAGRFKNGDWGILSTRTESLGLSSFGGFYGSTSDSAKNSRKSLIVVFAENPH